MRISPVSLALSALAVGLMLATFAPSPAAGFSLFRRSTDVEATSTGNFTRTAKLLVRTVDAPNPYFRSMMFQVPYELNYMLGEYLHKDFSRSLARHCNFSADNITMIVRNDLQLLLTDYDILTLQDGDRIEVSTNSSGSPTRAKTAAAWAKTMCSKKNRRDRPPPPPMGPDGRRCRGRRCPDGSRGRPGRPGGRGRPVTAGEDATVDLETEMPIGEEPIVVPNWEEMDD